MEKTVNNCSEVIDMKKRKPDRREEMLELRARMENIENKLAMTNEPLLLDALSYELLGVRARMNFLIACAKTEQPERV